MAPDADSPGGATPQGGERPEVSLGQAITDVSDRATLLVAEEIALAKAEVSEKISKIVAGSVAGLAAGLFVAIAVIMLFHALAWVLTDLLGDYPPWGFLATGGILLLAAAGAGLFAWRSVKEGSPPVPEMAIEEARKTREELAPAGEEEEEEG